MSDLLISILILNYEPFGRPEDASNCLNHFTTYHEDLRGRQWLFYCKELAFQKWTAGRVEIYSSSTAVEFPQTFWAAAEFNMSSLINSRFQNRDFANQLTSNKNHMAFVYKFVILFTRWKTEKGYYQYQRADTNHCDCVTSFTFNAVLTSQCHFILNTVLYKYSLVEQW